MREPRFAAWNRLDAARVGLNVTTESVRMAEERHFSRVGPAIVSVAVAVVCVALLVLLARSSWHRPQVKPPEVAQSTTTGQAARSAGAQVLPTEPKPAIEPTPAAPPPAQPANPD